MEKLLNFEYNGKKFAIVRPTQEDLMKIDMEHRKAFAEGVRNGLMTQFEAQKRFEKDGVWGKEDEEKMQMLQTEIVTIENELKDKKGPDGRKLAFQLSEKRNSLMELINHKTQLFSGQTAEGYAIENKLVTFAALCTVDKSGKRVFGSKQAFIDNEDHSFTATCYGQASMADYGMNEDDLNPEYLERKWLVENGYIDSDGNFTKQYYNEILEEGGVTKPKKKTAKKKKTTKKKKTSKKKKTAKNK